MNNIYDTIKTLNQLIRVHYDRIEGYHVAGRVVHADTQLNHLFYGFRTESNKCIHQLAQQVVHCGGTPTHTVTVSGRVYRSWMQVKSGLLVHDKRAAILDSCHFGEYIIQRAYKTVLEQRDDMPDGILVMILTQDGMLKCAHDSLKSIYAEALHTS